MTPVAKLVQRLVGGPLNRTALTDVYRGIQIARSWLDVHPTAAVSRRIYPEALERLGDRREQLLAERAAQVAAAQERARLDAERRTAGRERLAALAKKKKEDAIAIHAARAAEVAQARGLVALAYLDALLEHHQAIDAWVEACRVAEVCEMPAPLWPRTSLDRLEAEHGVRHTAILARGGIAGLYGTADVRPLEAWPKLGHALDELALVAWKLEHPSARGDEHFVTRRAAGTNQRGAAAWGAGWEVACRYCGEVIGEGGPGTVHTSSSRVRRHSTICAIQYLAGMIPGLPPGQRPAKQPEPETQEASAP